AKTEASPVSQTLTSLPAARAVAATVKACTSVSARSGPHVTLTTSRDMSRRLRGGPLEEQVDLAAQAVAEDAVEERRHGHHAKEDVEADAHAQKSKHEAGQRH